MICLFRPMALYLQSGTYTRLGSSYDLRGCKWRHQKNVFTIVVFIKKNVLFVSCRKCRKKKIRFQIKMLLFLKNVFLPLFLFCLFLAANVEKVKNKIPNKMPRKVFFCHLYPSGGDFRNAETFCFIRRNVFLKGRNVF